MLAAVPKLPQEPIDQLVRDRTSAGKIREGVRMSRVAGFLAFRRHQQITREMFAEPVPRH